ncbi:SPOR domain-containing protein [Seohaeicola zhoushanensis]|uniref:Sporulation protein n=1 Tax=Seohaeicola zhoushanensis TaxID=1569283 RepID=A0A8J3GW35_9RHOB|nr:SPOR domain-containing protein [Seohaeicola zhoushanensis]GHF46701.1 sporulation protein [Seohaeicola zhoushanensis]
MADIEYTDAVAGPDSGPATGGLGKLVNIAGALASLVLIAGICVWGYKLWVRDVSGVPVVRAIEGPMRVAPKEPGGEMAGNQGLAVNAVAAQGTAAPVAESIKLAPKAVELTEEDRPMTEETAAAAEPRSQEELTKASVDSLVQQLINGNAEDAEEPASDAGAIVQPARLNAADVPEVKAFDGPGLSRSLRPRARPEKLAALAAEEIEEGDSVRYTGKVREADPESVPSGAKLAQLGAFDSPDTARSEWDKLNIRFGDYLGDKTRVVQKATSGGRTFYRLRAMGFNDMADARRFCAVLAAEKADCIPVTTR